MRKSGLIAAAFAAALLVAGGLAVDAEAGPFSRDRRGAGERAIAGPGEYEYALRHDGLRRKYLVHVPPSYRGGERAPVVLALHGGGGTMRYQANDERYGLIEKSDAAGFIAVFPNGYAKNRRGLFATWNAGACCGAARDEKIDDVGFLKAVVADVARRASIDAKRVYAIGMSNGGLMAYRLACETPGMIRAAMAVAGTDNTTTCPGGRPVSILHIHALNDDHVLYGGGAGPAARDPSKVTDFVSVPATIEKWRSRNSCPAEPARVLTVEGAWCDRYAPCADDSAVMLCTTETGGHSWPGGAKRRADEPPSGAIIANDVMWDFFESLERRP
jgi:polyhydroxybutyrate depolymerase